MSVTCTSGVPTVTSALTIRVQDGVCTAGSSYIASSSVTGLNTAQREREVGADDSALLGPLLCTPAGRFTSPVWLDDIQFPTAGAGWGTERDGDGLC